MANSELYRKFFEPYAVSDSFKPAPELVIAANNPDPPKPRKTKQKKMPQRRRQPIVIVQATRKKQTKPVNKRRQKSQKSHKRKSRRPAYRRNVIEYIWKRDGRRKADFIEVGCNWQTAWHVQAEARASRGLQIFVRVDSYHISASD